MAERKEGRMHLTMEDCGWVGKKVLGKKGRKGGS
jgi:hypothetical protein